MKSNPFNSFIGSIFKSSKKPETKFREEMDIKRPLLPPEPQFTTDLESSSRKKLEAEPQCKTSMESSFRKKLEQELKQRQEAITQKVREVRLDVAANMYNDWIADESDQKSLAKHIQETTITLAKYKKQKPVDEAEIFFLNVELRSANNEMDRYAKLLNAPDSKNIQKQMEIVQGKLKNEQRNLRHSEESLESALNQPNDADNYQGNWDLQTKCDNLSKFTIPMHKEEIRRYQECLEKLINQQQKILATQPPIDLNEIIFDIKGREAGN